MKEKSIETTIMMRIRYLGGWCQKVQSGAVMMAGRGGKRYKIKLADIGTPDIIACVNGRFVAIEVKKDEATVAAWDRSVERESNRTALAQWRQQQMIIESGGVAFVSCSADNVEKSLRALKIIK